MISRTAIVMPASFQPYLDAVSEDTVTEALRKNTRRLRKFLKHVPKKKINYAYAEGKWTIKEVLQHMIDTERVFTFRALHFVRKDAAPLPGFDENIWAIAAKAPKRKWDDLVEELLTLRAANELFFKDLDDEQLLTTGTANNYTAMVAGLGFACAGHVQHHMNVIRERYLGETVKKKKPWKV